MEWNTGQHFINAIGEGSIFGEGDILEGLPGRTHTAIASQNPTSVYFAEVGKFMESQKYLKGHFRIFKDAGQEKWDFRNSQMEKRKHNEALRKGKGYEEISTEELERKNYHDM